MSVEGLNEDWMMENNKLSEVTQMQKYKYDMNFIICYTRS